MSKLEIIKQAFAANPLVDVVEELRMESIPSMRHLRSQGWVKYWVAPMVALYTATDLQKFMLSLVPGLVPSSKDDFYEGKYVDHGTYLRFGELEFVEVIGHTTVHRKLVFSDEDYKALAGKEIVEDEETFQITRKITIHVYPSREISLEHRNAKDVSYSVLARYMHPARGWLDWLGFNQAG